MCLKDYVKEVKFRIEESTGVGYEFITPKNSTINFPNVGDEEKILKEMV